HQVSHGGTYAGNRVAAAAAVATLTILKETDALATVAATGQRLQGEVRSILERRGLPFVFTGNPTMFGVMFTDRLPTDYRGWADTDHDLYDALAKQMIPRGAMPEPDSREPWFMCEAHAAGDDLDRVVSAFEGALEAALDERAGSPA
ncbi:MAG TPA: aminotransferase class III-fold pyridoxal phosphate-dependent enzyme, partial [Candidatus Baltobacteraceae bacterium]|nr:aminotransferase class III-fold pyridoxal phosphate-dependent enzyme [Candidatus Baltobacteraceae bacterium]